MSTTARPIFSVLLKRFRRAAGLTQQALAERAGYSAVYVSMLERGQRQPLPATVQLLATALDLSAHDRELLLTAARGRDGAADRRTARRDTTQPLIGRARELGAIETQLVGASPPVLALAGEPGIGKTRLLREAVARGAAYGWRVLRAGCQRRGGQEPYAPLLGAIEQYLRDAREREPARLRADLAGCAWLARLRPELAEAGLEPLPAWTVAPEQERRLVAAAVSRFLTNVAGPAGTVLVLDDLQWAGLDALDLLTALVRAAPRAPLRLIVAYRDNEVRPGDPLANTLADLAHAGLVTHLTLAPLAGQDAGRLFDRLVADVQPTLRERLLRRAEGLPFFIVSCAQALRSGTMVNDEDQEDDAIPWDVAQSVRQRVAALPEAAHELLDLAAVAGRRAPRALLLALSGRPERETLAALELACRARLLEESAEAYHFAHDVVREVFEGDMGAGRRAALHRRVAETVEQGWEALAMREEPLELLAYHYARGGAEDTAAEYLERAGDRARGQAARTSAEEYYREAVGYLERTERTADVARVREKLGTLLATVARFEEALAALDAAAASYRAQGDLDGWGRTVARIGDALADSGAPEDGIRRLLPLLEPLERAHARHGLIALYEALASLFFVGGRYDEQLAAAMHATELAVALGDDKLLLQAELGRAVALTMTERNVEALQVFAEAARLAETLGDPDGLSRALGNMAAIYTNAGELDKAASYVARALDAIEQVGDPVRVVRLTCTRGIVAFFAGDWRGARADFEAALTTSRQVGMSSGYAYPLFYLGYLCIGEGAWDEAIRYLDESIGVATEMGDLQVLRWARAGRAWCDIQGGRPAPARDNLTALLDSSGRDGQGISWVLLFLAWAYLDLGDGERAADTATRAVAHARVEHDQLSLVDALWIQAMVATRQARWIDAERFLEEALALARPMPYRYAEGRLLHLSGLLCLDRGEPRPARERLEAALAIFRRLGARQDIERAEQVLDEVDTAWTRRPDRQVSDAQWAAIDVLLPPSASTGRRRADDRRTLEAILYVRRTGRAWADLPTAFGDDATAHRCLAEWRASGLWVHIEEIVRQSPAGAATGVGAATRGVVEP